MYFTVPAGCFTSVYIFHFAFSWYEMHGTTNGFVNIYYYLNFQENGVYSCRIFCLSHRFSLSSWTSISSSHNWTMIFCTSMMATLQAHHFSPGSTDPTVFHQTASSHRSRTCSLGLRPMTRNLTEGSALITRLCTTVRWLFLMSLNLPQSSVQFTQSSKVIRYTSVFKIYVCKTR
jgi:hypothetical protein